MKDISDEAHGAISSSVINFLFTYTLGVILNIRVSWPGHYLYIGPIFSGLITLMVVLVTMVMMIFPISEEWDRKNNPGYSHEFLQGHRNWGWLGNLLGFLVASLYCVMMNQYDVIVSSIVGVIPLFLVLGIEMYRWSSLRKA
jgi:hypothetical protein